jgi:hypothetical protein
VKKVAAVTPEPKAPGPYQVRLDPDFKREWSEWCAAHGLIQGAAVARALTAFMEHGGES